MENKIYLLIGLICYSISAQKIEPIQTDRPDQTECPFITPEHFLQFEIGFTYQKSSTNSSEISIPTILSKFGLTPKLELRLITENIIFNENRAITSSFRPLAIGFKTQLLEENGILPTLSLIGHFNIPKNAFKKVQNHYYSPEFRFAMQHTLNKKQILSYNLGAEWYGKTDDPSFVYTLTTSFSFSEKLNGYIEVYGFIKKLTSADHRLNTGLNYLLNPNNQLDISTGIGLSNNSPNYFVALGYSLRFKI